jgi:uncharacterized Zn-finger protein
VVDFIPLANPTYNNNNGFQSQHLHAVVQGSNNNFGESGPAELNSNAPLPPFSSVGLSHYDGGMDPNNFQNRTTPPYTGGMQQQQQSTPNHSPQNNNSGGMILGHHDNGRESPLSRRRRQGGGGGGSDGSDGSLMDDEMLMMDGSSGSEDGGASSSDAGGGVAQQPRKEKPEVHECPLCSKTFNRICYFKQHFKQQHSNNSHSGGQLFKCPVCGKKFPESEVLADHMTKHGSNKPYKCEVSMCPKQFNHKTDLNRHRLLHTGDRPFICEQCGKGFIRKDHMTKHGETHRKKSNQSINNRSSASPP